MNRTRAKRPKTSIASTAIPEWLPDWRDESKYPDPTTASAQQWAWEFLRRNPEYQSLWNELIDPYCKSKKFDRNAAKKAFGMRIKSDSTFYSRHAAILDFGIEEPMKFLERKFGIKIPIPPSRPKPGLGFFLPYQYTRIRQHPSVKHFEENKKLKNKPYKIQDVLEPGDIAIWFNLNRPLEFQIEDAKKFLERRIKILDLKIQATRQRPVNFQNYLRVLDGKSRKADSSELARVIHGLSNEYPECEGSKQISYDFKVAKLLRDRDYLYIDPPLRK